MPPFRLSLLLPIIACSSCHKDDESETPNPAHPSAPTVATPRSEKPAVAAALPTPLPSSLQRMDDLSVENVEARLPACPASPTSSEWGRFRKVVDTRWGLEVRAPLVTNWNGTAFQAGAAHPPPRRAVELGTIQVNPPTFSYQDTDNVAIYACSQEQWKGIVTLAQQAKTMLGAGVRVGADFADVKEGVNAIQVIPNQVYARGSNRLLVSWVLPPGFRKGQSYPLVLTSGGYTVSNNGKLLAKNYVSGLYVRAMQGSSRGFILAMHNSGGKEAVGIHPGVKELLVGALDWGVRTLGVDKRRVVLFGASRSGITSTSHAGWLNSAGFKTVGIFANVPYPMFGTELTVPVELTPYNLASQYGILFGADIAAWLPYALRRSPASSEISRRILGVVTEAESNALAGDGQKSTLKALAAEGVLRAVVLGFGTQDPNQMYSTALNFHNEVAALGGVPVQSYFALGNGHSGAADFLDPLFLKFMADLDKGTPAALAVAKVFTRQGVACRNPKRVPFSARVPFK